MKMRDGRMRSPLLEEMLAATLGLALAGNLILCIVLPAQKWRWILSIAASAAAAGVSYLIGWLGYRRLASALYIGLLIIGFTGLAATAGGTHSPAMLSFPVLVMTSGMLLGDGAALVAGVACSLAGLGL